MNYRFIGWCQDGSSDKVWGAIIIREQTWKITCATFWGKRGGKLKTKIAEFTPWDLDKLIRDKQARGYRPVDRDQLAAVCQLPDD